MSFSPFVGFENIIFVMVPIITIGIFIFVFGIIIINSIKGIKQWGKNNESPILEVNATIVTKRENVHHHAHNTGANSMTGMSYSTTYYVTFEVQSGDCLEFIVSGKEYGALAERDYGNLTFRGTRYLGFERIRN